MPDSVKVLIVDDHPVVRAGLRAMLDYSEDIEVVADCATGAEAIEALKVLAQIDVVLLDLNLPDLRGETIVAEIERARPDAKVIVLTMEQDDARMVTALRSGAKAYLLKGADPDELLTAIRAVTRGELVIGSGASELVASYLRTGRTTAETAFPALTPREREVLTLLARNSSNDEIARRLAIRPKTVRNLVSSVLVKINARDRADAVLRARSAGLGANDT